MAFLFQAPCSIDIELDDKETRHTVEIQKPNGEPEKLFLFVGDDAVNGKVHIKVPEGKKIEHTGIKMELIGQIELFYDRGRHFVFTTLLNDFAEAGVLSGEVTYPFSFANLEKSNESYNGINVRLRYMLRCTISRSLLSNVTKELDFWVYSYGKPPEVNSSIKMEVGIEDCLHIEFEYNKSKYHLKDVIIGKIFFLLVRIKIKYMEISVIRRESTGSGPNLFNENETLTKYEIMDGAPVRGESIPVRMFLAPVELTPTYKNVHSKFSVRYFLNLVLVDEDDRRYFKQQEIVMWRKPPKKLKKKEVTEAHKKIALIQDESTNGNKPIQEPKPTPVEAPQQDLLS